MSKVVVTNFTSCLQLDGALMHRPPPGWWSSPHGTGRPTTERWSCDPGLVHSLVKFVFGCDPTDNFKFKIPSSPSPPFSLSSSSNICSPPSLHLFSSSPLSHRKDLINVINVWKGLCRFHSSRVTFLSLFSFAVCANRKDSCCSVSSLKTWQFSKISHLKSVQWCWIWISLLALSPVSGLVEGSLWEELVQRWRGGGSAFKSEISQQQHNLKKELSPRLSDWLTRRKAAAGTWL